MWCREMVLLLWLAVHVPASMQHLRCNACMKVCCLLAYFSVLVHVACRGPLYDVHVQVQVHTKGEVLGRTCTFSWFHHAERAVALCTRRQAEPGHGECARAAVCARGHRPARQVHAGACLSCRSLLSSSIAYTTKFLVLGFVLQRRQNMLQVAQQSGTQLAFAPVYTLPHRACLATAV